MEIVFSNSDRGVINRAKSEGFLGPLQNTKDLFDQTISLGGAFDIGPVNCSPICNQRKQLIRSTFYSGQLQKMHKLKIGSMTIGQSTMIIIIVSFNLGKTTGRFEFGIVALRVHCVGFFK